MSLLVRTDVVHTILHCLSYIASESRVVNGAASDARFSMFASDSVEPHVLSYSKTGLTNALYKLLADVLCS